MLQIDGSKHEGGGAILRTATALSAITNQDIHVTNIRKGRKKSGLRPQHLSGIKAAAELCSAQFNNVKQDSEEIEFKPGKIEGKHITVDIDTAGSITLVLQGLIPIALQASEPTEIHFRGGATDTFFSPTIDYFQNVFLKNLERMGVSVDLDIKRRGYYPQGGAEVIAKIKPSNLRTIHLLKKKRVKEITMKSGAATQLKDKSVAHRQISGADEVLPDQLPIKEEENYYNTKCPGSHISLIANFSNSIIGTDNIGKLKKRAEQVGKEAALELLEQQKSDGCLDKYMADQILIYMALAGDSKITVSEVTDHCKTNIWLIEKFLEGSFEVKENKIKWTTD
ncbi:MAG: RNA 3'-terminal phosphate cyclase [Candidatus Paceibacterota bacterium]